MLNIDPGKEICFDGNIVPHPDILSTGWVDDVHKWPDTQSANVILYLLESPSDFDGKALKAYKSTKAFSYYKDGWVKTCYYHAISSTSKYCFIKANVLPSFKINEKHHKTWVLLEKADGGIITASCSCMAGLGRCCNHAAALLFKIEDAVKLGFNSLSCTSMPCSWNKGCLKPVENLPLMEIQNLFKQEVHCKVKKRKLNKIDFEPMTAKSEENEGKSLFENVLKGVAEAEPSAPVLKCLPEETLSKFDINIPTSSVVNRSPLSLMEQARIYVRNLSEPEKNHDSITSNFIHSLAYTQKEINDIEEMTREQANSSNWLSFRKGMITASNAKLYGDKITVIKNKRNKTDCQYLISKSLLEGNNCLSHVKAVRWGLKHENDAANAYREIENQKHKGLQLERCGLFVSSEYPFLGASPDRVAKCLCCPCRTIEIKCPYSIKDKDPTDENVLQELDFISYENGVPKLDKEHKYYSQVQMQMAVANVTSSDFVVWTTKNIQTLHVKLDISFWANLRENLLMFFSEFLCPVILATV